MLKVRVLKSRGFAANMLIAGGEYGTALHAASYKGHLGLVKLLLAKGADVNAQRRSFSVPRICN
jgi:ankyrin repeat protein